MTREEKLQKLIDMDYPLEASINGALESFREMFRCTVDGITEARAAALEAFEAQLRATFQARQDKLKAVFDKHMTDAELDAMLSFAPKAFDCTKEALDAGNDWRNAALDASPALKDIAADFAAYFVAANTSGEASESLTRQAEAGGNASPPTTPAA